MTSNFWRLLLRDHPLKRSASFHDFWPLPPYHRHSSKMLMKGIFDPHVLWPFDLLSIGTWGHPSPLRHADVLKEWSLIWPQDLKTDVLFVFFSYTRCLFKYQRERNSYAAAVSKKSAILRRPKNLKKISTLIKKYLVMSKQKGRFL